MKPDAKPRRGIGPKADDRESLALAQPIRIATCCPLPEPDPDEAPLVASLRALGADVEMQPWNASFDAVGEDFAACWGGALVVIRSTWDYYHRNREFLAWTRRIERCATLLNSASTVAWNIHKEYLLALRDAGIPTVPTVLVSAGSGGRMKSHLTGKRWERVVIKPAISAASFETRVFDIDDCDDEWFAELISGRDLLLQPFVESVLHQGETAVVYIDGQLTHAVRKSPRFAGQDERVSAALEIPLDVADLARAAFAAVPTESDFVYGRVDVVFDERGGPMVAELELIEPSLFLMQCSRALDRFSRALMREARRTR